MGPTIISTQGSVHHSLSDESAMRGIESPIGALPCVWRKPSELGPPADREIHLWSGQLDSAVAQLPALNQLLSATERQRAAQFHFETDRRRFIVRRGMLRAILSWYLKTDPWVVEFQTGPHGKLHLAGEFALGNLDFSLTHSRGRLLVAVASRQQIGVDLESVQPLSDFERLVKQALLQSEIRVLDALPLVDRLNYFYRCWTGKEACLKANGAGLARRLDSVLISWKTDAGVGFAELQDNGSESQALWVRSFSPFDGYLAAIACLERPGHFEYFTI